jgi:hypothetical protein
MGAHACNPRYLGGGDQEDRHSRPGVGELSETPSQCIKQAWWCIYDPSCVGGIGKRIMVQCLQGNCRTLSEK